MCEHTKQKYQVPRKGDFEGRFEQDMLLKTQLNLHNSPQDIRHNYVQRQKFLKLTSFQ